ncbi:telomerase reverse transcriptase [Calliopsis andreniformis]|uniref:telomerase reverse transcriptase n=1 Tax=Calliopsis andreniformis TaxID=337506 RepID=UPI003FCC6E08
MDDYTAKSVKEVFGTDFQEYCSRHTIVLKENKYGAFKAPNVNVLKECIDVIEKYKLNVNDRIQEIQKYKQSSNVSKRSKRQHKTNTLKCQKAHSGTADVSTNLYLTNLQLNICLYDTSAVLPGHTVNTIPADYILNTAKSGNEIYDFIIKNTMKETVIIDYEVSIPSISCLLTQLQKQHKKFHYFSIIKHLYEKQEIDHKLKCQYELTFKQLKVFFNLIFAKVVPLKLFGKLRNIKKMKKAMFDLLDTPRLKSFNLLPYIEKLDISCIAWLQNIQSVEVQWLVLAKFIKWFFNGFLIKVLRTQFHITSLSATNNKRLYITRPNWCYIQKKFIKQKIRSNTLQPDVEYNEWSPPIGIYKLRAKHSNVRPIFMSQHQPNEKKDLNIVFQFLRQVQITEYGFNDFYKRWKTITQKYKSKTESLCLISCDVMDAFGSIIQGHLHDFILSLCNKLPETLTLRTYVIKSGKCVDSDSLHYKQYFCHQNLELPLSPGTLYACTSRNNCQLIKKSWLLEKIWKYIFYQRVKIRKKIYIIGKGIIQGGMLSPILSDIYYNFVLNEQMSIFLKSGEIIRYTDDILYITENEIIAKQFLQVIKTGIPKYNCWFKELKTQSNISNIEGKTTKSINYIGYKINSNTLEIEPKDLSTDMRYLISFSLKNNLTPLELLKKRINNMTCLKVSKVVMDNTINSKTTIKTILQKTCLFQVKRAYILIKELFIDIHKIVPDIRKIIKNNNKKVAKHIIKGILNFEENMSQSDIWKWNNRILCMLWRFYKNIFKKDKILRNIFIETYKH